MPKTAVKKSRGVEVVAKKRGRPRKPPVVEEVQKRRPGRTRKENSGITGAKQALAYARGDKKAGKATVVEVNTSVRRHKVANEQLLQAEVQSRRVALAANRAVEQVQGMLARAHVEQFRGRKERPQLVLSLLEQQTLQDMLALYNLKLELQRGGRLRRKTNE